jgi:hypothetical protein
MAKRTTDEDGAPRFDGVLAVNGAYGLPAVRTLSDEYRDVAEPEDSSRVPPPERPGVAARVIGRLRALRRTARRRTS